MVLLPPTKSTNGTRRTVAIHTSKLSKPKGQPQCLSQTVQQSISETFNATSRFTLDTDDDLTPLCDTELPEEPIPEPQNIILDDHAGLVQTSTEIAQTDNPLIITTQEMTIQSTDMDNQTTGSISASSHNSVPNLADHCNRFPGYNFYGYLFQTGFTQLVDELWQQLCESHNFLDDCKDRYQNDINKDESGMKELIVQQITTQAETQQLEFETKVMKTRIALLKEIADQKAMLEISLLKLQREYIYLIALSGIAIVSSILLSFFLWKHPTIK